MGLLLSNTASAVTKIKSKTKRITFFGFSEPFFMPSLSEMFPGIEQSLQHPLHTRSAQNGSLTVPTQVRSL